MKDETFSLREIDIGHVEGGVALQEHAIQFFKIKLVFTSLLIITLHKASALSKIIESISNRARYAFIFY